MAPRHGLNVLRGALLACALALCTAQPQDHEPTAFYPPREACSSVETQFLKAQVEEAMGTDCLAYVRLSPRMDLSLQQWMQLIDDLAFHEVQALSSELLACTRRASLKRRAAVLCSDEHHEFRKEEAKGGGAWEIRHILWTYADDNKQNKLAVCDTCTNPEGQPACIAAHKKQDMSQVVFGAPAMPRTIYQFLKKHTFHTINSLLDFGGGNGMHGEAWARAGVRDVVGIEPHFYGSLTYFADDWDARYRPVQVDSFIGSDAGDLRFSAFLCKRFRTALQKEVPPFDVLWTSEVFEHIPIDEHCHLLNALSGLTHKFVATSIAHPGQRGRGHIACRTKEDWAAEWRARGFEIVEGSEGLLEGTDAPWFILNNMIFLHRVQPHTNVNCSAVV